jgi:hypothetical protein
MIRSLQNINNGISEPKKNLLYYHKVMQQAGLELANFVRISRMAVPKHLVSNQGKKRSYNYL